MRKLYSVIFLVLGILPVSFPSMGQNAKSNSTEISRDSLLNEMTDIDKQVQEVIQIDTIGGRAFRRMLDTYLKDLNNQPIYQLNRNEKGLLNIPKEEWYPFADFMTFNDTVIQNPAFLPVIFDGRLLPDKLTFLSSDSSYVNRTVYPQYHLISPDSTFVAEIEQSNKTKKLRRSYYVNNPQNIVYNGLIFDKTPVLKESKIKRASIFDELLTTDDPIGLTALDIEKTTIKKSYWRYTGEHSLHLSQTYLSDTWHAGGDDKWDIKNYHKITLDYKKDKITLNNRVEWELNASRISIYEEPGQSLKKLGISTDYLKIYSVFGVEAYRKWSYSANLSLSTPLFQAFKVNTKNTKLRIFLSPFDMNLGLGMRYEYEHISKADKYNNVKLAIDLSPLSFQYRYIKDTEVINSSTNYGIKDGHIRREYGSKIVGNMAWSFNRYFGLTSELTYFTDYDRTQIDMVSRFNYQLNRFFSIRASLDLRFDDSASKKDDTLGIDYLQYNETVSFGLTYKW